MKKDCFRVSEDFVLTKLVESIFIDVKYELYDLQLIVQYEMDKGKITKFEVWSGAKDSTTRFYEFEYDNSEGKYKFETIEEVLDFIYYNYNMGNITFCEIIEEIEGI